METNLDALVRVNLNVGATPANVADVTTVLGVLPTLMTTDVLTFYNLEDALASPAVAGDYSGIAAEVVRAAFAQAGVKRFKLTGSGNMEGSATAFFKPELVSESTGNSYPVSDSAADMFDAGGSFPVVIEAEINGGQSLIGSTSYTTFGDLFAAFDAWTVSEVVPDNPGAEAGEYNDGGRWHWIIEGLEPGARVAITGVYTQGGDFAAPAGAPASDVGPWRLEIVNTAFGAFTTAEARLAEIMSADDGWIALWLPSLAPFPGQNERDSPFFFPARVKEFSDAVEALGGSGALPRLLVVDALLIDGDPTDAAAEYEPLKGAKFTTLFAATPPAGGGPDDLQFGVMLHGLMTAANRLARDADRGKAGWAWTGLERAQPSTLPAGLVSASASWLNVYGRNRGLAITARGVTTRGTPVHAIVAAIWAAARCGESITNALYRQALNAGSVDYDQQGIGIVRAAIDDVLQRAVKLKHAVDGSPRINVADIEDVPQSDINAEHLTARAGFKVQGSIVSVELDLLASMDFDPADIGLENDGE